MAEGVNNRGEGINKASRPAVNASLQNSAGYKSAPDRAISMAQAGHCCAAGSYLKRSDFTREITLKKRKLKEQDCGTMAKYVCENPPLPGNYGSLQVYIDRGITCARVPNPLCGKRVKTAPEFANTRKYAAVLAIASPLASAAHNTLPASRQRAHYHKLVGKAVQWVKAGKSADEIQVLLTDAADSIRKELKSKRIKALIHQKKKGRKPVFSIPAATIPFDIDDSIPTGRVHRARRSVFRNVCAPNGPVTSRPDS